MASQQAAQHDPASVFMQQLGIHPAEQMRFGWIAQYGLKEEALPPRWAMHMDHSSGHVYYVDRDSQSSTWENPLTPSLLRVLETGRLYLQQPSETFFTERKQQIWNQHKWEVECWCGPFKDSSGRPYFANSVTGVSSWRDPREETQYIFELESSLLSNLQEVLPRPRDLSPRQPRRGEPGLQARERPAAAARGTASPAGRAAQEQPWAPPGRASEAWGPGRPGARGEAAGPADLARGPLLEGFCRLGGAEIFRVPESRLTSPATEVLTAESFRAGSAAGEPPEARLQTPVKLQAEARHVSIAEHKSALDKLGSAAKWLRSKALEEEEAQRSTLSRKMEARLLRKQVAAPASDVSPGTRSSGESAAEEDGAAVAAPQPCLAAGTPGVDGAD